MSHVYILYSYPPWYHEDGGHDDDVDDDDGGDVDMFAMEHRCVT